MLLSPAVCQMLSQDLILYIKMNKHTHIISMQFLLTMVKLYEYIRIKIFFCSFVSVYPFYIPILSPKSQSFPCEKGCSVKSRSPDLGKQHLLWLLGHAMALCQPPQELWLCWQNWLFLPLIIYSEKERLSHTPIWHSIGYRSVSLFSFYLSISITSSYIWIA